MNYDKEALKLHEEKKGKIEVISKVSLNSKDDLSISYTPGVAEPCRKIHENPEDVYKYTIKGNSVAVVTDGSAVLGLGNIGPKAGMPVMEGKCALFKEFGNVDAYPILIDSQDTDEIVKTIKLISPGFGGINLEDISAPRCFEIEDCLKKELDIPVFHDDQHGTAIVVAAGMINALKLANKKIEKIRIIINGAGAAGIAIANLLLTMGAKHIIMCDSKGAIHVDREDLNKYKQGIADITKYRCEECTLQEALVDSDVFIGVSKANLLTSEDVSKMADKAIIFAMANPNPEITPDEAKKGNAFIVATGRSDFPNQVNNVLAFPGIFRGVLDSRAKQITEEMKIAAAQALADYVKNPGPEMIIPNPLDKGVAKAVAKAVMKVK